MTSRRAAGRVLRWYPRQWRDRYGEELLALLEDSFPDGEVPLLTRWSIARSGVVERAHDFTWNGVDPSTGDRLRAGSIGVLIGWSLCIGGGAIFAKFAEHWDAVTPTRNRWIPSLGYDVVQWSGILGVALTFVAALTVVPAFVRLMRRGAGQHLRSSVTWAACAMVVTVVSTVALARWAHHLSAHARNGGLFGYGVAFLAWGVLVFTSLALATRAAAHVARDVQLTSKHLEFLAAAARVLTTLLTALVVGFVVWWAGIAAVAPTFLSSDGSALANPFGVFPPALLVASLALVAGLAVAIAGFARMRPFGIWSVTSHR